MFNNNQNKPPAFPLPQPIEQQPADYNWNSSQMPWKTNEATAHTVMLFNGMNLGSQDDTSPSTSGHFNRQPRVKRKSESDDFIPSKHFISEDKMIAHMNGLHLSDNFQQHNVTPEPTESTSKSSEEPFHLNLSKEELEKRLKRAQRIIVCEQVKKTLQEEKEIINRMIMSRMEPPCRALVLWKPPQLFDEKLLANYDNPSASIQEEGSENEMEDDNNNNNDPNNNLDDVMME